jgi:hypothetical protein
LEGTPQEASLTALEKTVRALIKTYTSEACYRQISQSLVNGMQENCVNYLTLLLKKLENLNTSFTYSDSNTPLYRGIAREFIKMEDYQLNKVHFWAAFSSSSKSKDVAVNMARRGKPKGSHAVVFNIYVSDDNSPITNIDLPRTWSFYPSEQEVLLLPFFCFQVVKVTEDLNTAITEITVVEVPK